MTKSAAAVPLSAEELAELRKFGERWEEHMGDSLMLRFIATIDAQAAEIERLKAELADLSTRHANLHETNRVTLEKTNAQYHADYARIAELEAALRSRNEIV